MAKYFISASAKNGTELQFIVNAVSFDNAMLKAEKAIRYHMPDFWLKHLQARYYNDVINGVSDAYSFMPEWIKPLVGGKGTIAFKSFKDGSVNILNFI